MASGGKRKNEDGDDSASPFEGVQKNAVLNEARSFHDLQINAKKCARVMTKILYLLQKGDTLTSQEVTGVFFGVTKLFRAQDIHLRRMIYAMIKALKVNSDESLIVVSCLSKDITASRIDVFRANAIRVLATVIDANMLGQIDRFLKQAIVDKNPLTVSSALMAGLHMFPKAPDVVKRWVNEVQEATRNSAKMVQYHALMLLYRIKQQDRLAVIKMVQAMARDPPRGHAAQCLLVRYVANVVASQQQPDKELFKYLLDCLHDKNFMVMYECARILCRLPNVSAVDITPAISVLQEFLTSPISVHRFAAVRTLSEIVQRYPLLVNSCSSDLEHLLGDSNRSIATLAITTLLKTGREENVDTLLKNITGFISEISDEFKIVLVDAIKTLSLKFPHKYKGMMNFLSQALREEGGESYKRAIVNAMLEIISHIKDAKAEGLEHFCEFIEDCEFAELSIKILHLLGEEGPKTANPAKYIRYIFNRVILEAPQVRCAAVSALAKFGLALPSLWKSVVVLLHRAQYDNDDEVRDRVAFYLSALQSEKKGDFESAVSDFKFSSRALEVSLAAYLREPDAAPFSLDKHLLAVEEKEEKAPAPLGGLPVGDLGMAGAAAGAAAGSAAAAGRGAGAGAQAVAEGKALVANPYLDVLSQIPEFAELGPLFRSTEPVQITEEESEYQVSCIKHIYPQHVVFQFNVTNNMKDQRLEEVQVEMDPIEGSGWSVELVVPEAVIEHESTGACFVCMSRPRGTYSSGPVSNELKFNYKSVDRASGEVSETADEDSYRLEEVSVTEKDFVIYGESIGLVEFKTQWEQLGEAAEKVKKYQLGLSDLQEAVNAVVDLLGLRACENSDRVPSGRSTHAVNLSGVFVSAAPVFCRIGLQEAGGAVTLKIAVRCRDVSVSELLVNIIGNQKG